MNINILPTGHPVQTLSLCLPMKNFETQKLDDKCTHQNADTRETKKAENQSLLIIVYLLLVMTDPSEMYYCGDTEKN